MSVRLDELSPQRRLISLKNYTQMANQSLKTSPQTIARIGGLLYLIIIVTGIFGELFVRSKLIVSGDPAITANNIMASQLSWRISIAGDMIMHICDVPLMLIFYLLLRPVNRNLALLAVLLNLVQTAVLVANELNLLTPLFLSGGADYLNSLEPHQLHALTYLSLKNFDHGFGMGLIYFGLCCLVNGYLIFKSGYLPRALGVLMQIAGLCYLTNSFALILSPTIAHALFPVILLPPFIGEFSLCLWLLLKGVNISKWNSQTGAGQSS
jgi:Domain of unknown function (DUF4386)